MASNNAFQGGPSGRNSRNGNNPGGPNSGGPGNNSGNGRGGAGVIGNFSDKKYGQGANNQMSKMGKNDMINDRSMKNQKKNVGKDFRPSQVRNSSIYHKTPMI